MPDGDGGPIAVGGFLFFSVLDRRKSSGEEYGDDVPGRQDPTNPLSISPSLSLSLSLPPNAGLLRTCFSRRSPTGRIKVPSPVNLQ